MGDLFVMWFIGLAVAIGIWLLCREVVCWYFKINQSLKELQDINQNLVKMNKMLQRVVQSGAAGGTGGAVSASEDDTDTGITVAGNTVALEEDEDMGDAVYFCPRCGATFRAKDGEIPWCGNCNLQTQFTGYFETNWYDKDREEREALVQQFMRDAAQETNGTPQVNAAPQAFYCDECGTRLPAGATFCSKCGKPVR